MYTRARLPQRDGFAWARELPKPYGAIHSIESAQVLTEKVQRKRKSEGIEEAVVVNAHDPKELHRGQGQGQVVAGVVEKLPQRGGIADVAGVLACWRRWCMYIPPK